MSETWEEYLEKGVKEADRTMAEIGLIRNNQVNQFVNFSWLEGVYEHLKHIYDIQEELLKTRTGLMESQMEIRRLLGLHPDATRQEIVEAIDDVAPLIADYRRKKRGT